jgi:hypothetical protein
MHGRSWRAGVLMGLFAVVMLCGAQALNARGGGKDKGDGVKGKEPIKAEDFKGKTFKLKEKGKGRVTLIFTAGKPAHVTVKSKEKTDVNLFIYDSAKKRVAKDDSPGPDCDLTFTPKADGEYTLVVVNLGPGENSSTLKVHFKKGKATDTSKDG